MVDGFTRLVGWSNMRFLELVVMRMFGFLVWSFGFLGCFSGLGFWLDWFDDVRMFLEFPVGSCLRVLFIGWLLEFRGVSGLVGLVLLWCLCFVAVDCVGFGLGLCVWLSAFGGLLRVYLVWVAGYGLWIGCLLGCGRVGLHDLRLCGLLLWVVCFRFCIVDTVCGFGVLGFSLLLIVLLWFILYCCGLDFDV